MIEVKVLTADGDELARWECSDQVEARAVVGAISGGLVLIEGLRSGCKIVTEDLETYGVLEILTFERGSMAEL